MVNLKALRLLATCLAMLGVLSACGGSAPGASATPTPTPTPVTPTPTASSSDLSVDKVSIASAATGASAQVLLTVTAKDSQNRTVADVPVVWQASSGNITPIDTKTKPDGTAQARLDKGSSRSNRTITVTATLGSLAITQTVDVTGTFLLAQASAGIIPLNDSSKNITYTLLDSAGNPIPNQTVNVTFSLLGGTVTSPPTNASGVTTVQIPSSPSSGNSTATAAAAGATKLLTLIYDNNPTPTPTPTPTNFSVQANPAVAYVNTLGSFANSSQIVVTVTGAGGALVDNALVSFRRGDTDPTVPASSFEFINDVPSSAGVAINRIRPATQGSGQNEVIVCVSVKNGSGVSITPETVYENPNPCGSNTEKPVFLTFAGQPLFISIGTGSAIENVDDLKYRKRFSVLVTNATGNPVADAIVSTVVRPRYYGKGRYLGPVPGGRVTFFPQNLWTGQESRVPAGSLWCPNEDLNNDGILQSGEDFNSSGDIEPRQRAVLTASNNGKTDVTGDVTLSLVYSKSFAYWIVVDIEVRAQVGGSEGVDVFTYYLLGSKDDADSVAEGAAPGFEISRFGTSTGTSNATEAFGGQQAASDCKNKN